MRFARHNGPRRRAAFLVRVAFAGVVLFASFRAAVANDVSRELALTVVGRCAVSWTPERGLNVRYDGVPLVHRSSLYVVWAGWSGLLLDQNSAPAVITPWTDTSLGRGKTARIVLENADAVCVYTLTLSAASTLTDAGIAVPRETLTVDLAYRLKRDAAGGGAEIEYAAGYLSGPVLQGATYFAVAGGGGAQTSGCIAATPPAAGRTQAENRLVPPFSRLVLNTRLVPVFLSYEGGSGAAPLPVIFDARADAQDWARAFPVFWMGIGSPPAPLTVADGERHATFTFAFAPDAPPAAELPALFPNRGEGKEGRAAPVGTRAVPDARAPVVPSGAPPLVIPRPKQMTLNTNGEPFRLTPATRIVVADGATARDKQGAEILRGEIKTRFNLDVPLVRARDASVRQGVNVIAIGDGERNALLTRLRAVFRLTPPDKPEGYALLVTPRAVLVAGRDARGVFWGTQTLLQLLAPGTAGPQIRPEKISDWPTLSIRAVHLFHGKNARPFHEKLIDRVLSRFKMNALFLQAEQLRWDADPAVAPAWAGRKADVKAEIAYAAKRNVTVYPLVQGLGHMEWLFGRPQNRAFAEDGEMPYALNVTNPAALAYLGRIMAEADDLFGAPAFHVGLDEVTMRGRFPHRSRGKTFADLFLAGARHWHDFFAKRGKPIWMWADMLLYGPEVAPSFGTAPTSADAARLRRELPKDIVLVDWQYSPRAAYPSLKVLRDAGFPLVAATWYDPDGIQKFSRAAADVGALGALQTTWAGYESSAAVLDTDQRKQFTAMVLAADYFWNGGAGPPPADLPYDAGEVFTRAYAASPSAEDTRTRAGWLVDLAAVANRPRADWLGYNGEAGLAAALPSNDSRLGDGVRYQTGEGVLLLAGKLNPPSADFPAERVIALGDLPASEVRLLVAASHRAEKGTRIGAVMLTTAGGKAVTVDLVYGENITAADDLSVLPGVPLVWRGRFDGGPSAPAAGLRSVAVSSPAPGDPVRSVTLSSANTEAAPALFALTALK